MSQHEAHALNGTALTLRAATTPVVDLSRVVRPSDAGSSWLAGNRDRLLEFARRQSLLPRELVPTTNSSSNVNFRSFVNLARNSAGSTSLPVLPFVDPITAFDSSLDDGQVDAVARALQTPDLLLIQGLPGSGKTRVAVEIVRQAVERSIRVLIVAPDGPSTDAVLSAALPIDRLKAIRLVARHESADGLAPSLLNLTPRRQEEFWLRHLIQQANEFAVEARNEYERLQAIERDLQNLNKARAAHQAECDRLREQKKAIRDHAMHSAKAPGHDLEIDNLLTACREENLEFIGRIDSKQAELREERARVELAVRSSKGECEALRPLIEARQSSHFWSVAFWKALLNKSLPQSLDAIQGKVSGLEQCLADSRVHEENLQLERKNAEAEFAAKEEALIELEIDRREREINVQIDGIEEQIRTLDKSIALITATSNSAPIASESADDSQTSWSEQLDTSIEKAELAGHWQTYVNAEPEAVLRHWRGSLSLVAGPISSISAEPLFFTKPFDLLIVYDADRFAETELLAVCQKARRWVLLGEPVATATTLMSSPRQNGSATRPLASRDLFGQLWDALHQETWVNEGDRLCCRLHRTSQVERRTLEREAVADRPDIELRILPNAGEPILAEVLFPPNMLLGEAKEYLFHELGEIPCQPRIRIACWEQSDGQWRLHLNSTVSDELPPIGVDLGDGVGLRMPHLSSGHSHAAFVFTFELAQGWDRAKAEAWAIQHLLKRDGGRTCQLQNDYRHTPEIAAWLNEAVVVGSRYSAATKHEGAVQFEAVPRRAPTAQRRGGAGYEINLADPRQRELLPDELARMLPQQGFANLPEAQAIADLVRQLPRDRSLFITAAYPAQAQVLQHYLPGDKRVVDPSALLHSECDVLIISLTRSHVSRAVTFGEEPSLLPRLFARARSRLILVGDPGTLARRVQWEGAIDDFDAISGEKERRWVNSLLRLIPSRNTPSARVPQGAALDVVHRARTPFTLVLALQGEGGKSDLRFCRDRLAHSARDEPAPFSWQSPYCRVYSKLLSDGPHFSIQLSGVERCFMSRDKGAELIPLGGGDSIPLIRPVMTVGRRESCDICLKFPNISGLHCELSLRDGYWFFRDLGSSNGIKVNGARTLQRPVRPGDEIAIANRRYTIQYNITSDAEDALESQLREEDGLRSMSLMEKAGLAKPKGRGDDD